MRISNKRLTSIDLIELGRRLGLSVEVYSRDNVPSPCQGQCYVINLDDAGSAGTHWVCFYRHRRRDGTSEILYCDSFGAPIPEEQNRLFLKDHATVHWNRMQIQPVESILCGWYCLGFLLHCTRHPVRPKDDPRDILLKWQSFFSEDTSTNDKTLRKFFASV
jgi:hypothetical protein